MDCEIKFSNDVQVCACLAQIINPSLTNLTYISSQKDIKNTIYFTEFGLIVWKLIVP